MKKAIAISILFILVVSYSLISYSHPGKTDASDGHYNRKTGQYHYHSSSAQRTVPPRESRFLTHASGTGFEQPKVNKEQPKKRRQINESKSKKTYKQRIETLEQQVKKLNARVEQLEQQLNSITQSGSELNQDESRGISISYEQVMEYLSDFFIMEKTMLVRGQDRYMGQTVDSLAILEIIGSKNNISQATLMIGIPVDVPDKLVRNTVLAMRFLENTVPEWTNSNEWITANAKRVADIPDVSDVKVVKGNKLITMTFLKPLGMLTLTVKHK